MSIFQSKKKHPTSEPDEAEWLSRMIAAHPLMKDRWSHVPTPRTVEEVRALRDRLKPADFLMYSVDWKSVSGWVTDYMQLFTEHWTYLRTLPQLSPHQQALNIAFEELERYRQTTLQNSGSLNDATFINLWFRMEAVADHIEPAPKDPPPAVFPNKKAS